MNQVINTQIGMTLTRDIGARMAVRPPRPPVGCKSLAYDDDEKLSTAWNKMDRWRAKILLFAELKYLTNDLAWEVSFGDLK